MSEEFLKKTKNIFNKFWDIVWRDNSPKGWIISIIFLFVLIKLIFFPTLSLITGTQIPLVIVESCSMYHEGGIFSNYNNWFENEENKYSNYKINKTIFQEFPFKKGFNKGDILFVTEAKIDKLKIGDVIIFNSNYKAPIIHRIINITKEGDTYFFSTLGDNNNGQLEIEKEINQNQIIGTPKLNILPYAGWIKLIFYENQKSDYEKGFCK